jgi:hypothetical protein
MNQPQPETIPGGYKQITSCRGCDSPKLTRVLNLGNQYVVGFQKERNDLAPSAPLELVLCEGCGLLQLRHSVDPDLLWRGDYWYRSSVNQTMRDALCNLVNNGIKWQKKGLWVDIGANDGYLLSRVPETFRKVGIEPSKSLVPLLEEHADIVINDFFGPHDAIENANVITSSAMFYDVDDPHVFLKTITNGLAEDGVWINQLADARAMLKSNAFDAICHEHKCYYDLHSLTSLYAQHGLVLVEHSFNDVNGGSIRTVAKRREGAKAKAEKLDREAIFEFADRAKRWKNLMQWMIEALYMAGRQIWGYGASTKGCALLQYLDRNQMIQAIADRNPIKDGLLMTGSWLKVTDELTMRAARPDVLLVLPWAFKAEMLEREKALRKSGTAMLMPLPNPEVIL